MDLIKTIEIGEKKINYNISAIVIVEHAAKFQKNIFDIFNVFAKLNKKKNEDEMADCLMENASVLSDFIEVAFTSISVANKNIGSFSDFLSQYQIEDLIRASGEIVKELYISNKPINKPQIKVKKSAKKKNKERV